MENATLLYVQACKFLLCGEDRSSWDELMAVLPRLRNALTCRVCRGLIVDPLGSKYCQHYVCRACLKRKRALNPGCKWCLDWSKLQESDGEVRVVLACYKLLCEAIKSSNYYVNTIKNSSIDNLLNEAILNTDVLPDSSFVASNSSPILDPKSKMTKMAVEVVSRDPLKTCAREEVENTTADNTALNDGGKFNCNANTVSETNGISQPSDEKLAEHSKISAMAIVEKNDQLQQDDAIKIETCVTRTNCINTNNDGDNTNIETNDTDNNSNTTNINANDSHANGNNNRINGDNEIQIHPNSKDPNSYTVGINSVIDHNGSKTHFVQKARSRNVRACLRPRNGQLVQKFEASRCMRKRNMIVKKNNAQTFSKPLDQAYRPRKRCKME